MQIALLLSLLITIISSATVHENAHLVATIDGLVNLPFTYPGGFGFVSYEADTVMLHLRSYDNIFADSDSYDITPTSPETQIPSSVVPIFDTGLLIRFRDILYIRETVVFFNFAEEDVTEIGPNTLRATRESVTGDEDVIAYALRRNFETASFIVLKFGSDDSFEAIDVNISSPLYDDLTEARDLFFFALIGDWIIFPFPNAGPPTTNISFYNYVTETTLYAQSDLTSYDYYEISLTADEKKVYLFGNGFNVFWFDTETWTEGEYEPTFSFVNYYPDSQDIWYQTTGAGGFLRMTTYDDNYNTRYYALTDDGSNWDGLFTEVGSESSLLCDQTNSFCYGVVGFGSNPVVGYKIESLGRFASPRSGFETVISYPTITGILDDDIIIVRGTGIDIFVFDVNNITTTMIRGEGTIVNYPAAYAVPMDREEGTVLFLVQDEAESTTEIYVWSMDNRFADVDSVGDSELEDDDTGDKDFANSLMITGLLSLAYLL